MEVNTSSIATYVMNSPECKDIRKEIVLRVDDIPEIKALGLVSIDFNQLMTANESTIWKKVQDSVDNKCFQILVNSRVFPIFQHLLLTNKMTCSDSELILAFMDSGNAPINSYKENVKMLSTFSSKFSKEMTDMNCTEINK